MYPLANCLISFSCLAQSCVSHLNIALEESGLGWCSWPRLRKSSNTTLNLPHPDFGPQRLSFQDWFSVRNGQLVQCKLEDTLCAQMYFMFLGFRASEMINISVLRPDHNNSQASVNSVGRWGAWPVIHRSRSQKDSSGRDVCCPPSWENSALSNKKCIWKGTLSYCISLQRTMNRSIEPWG